MNSSILQVLQTMFSLLVEAVLFYRRMAQLTQTLDVIEGRMAEIAATSYWQARVN